MNQKKVFVFPILLSILLYIVLHEVGHCIVAILCGAAITEFSILSAHMTYSGGRFTDLSYLWLDANGVVFPLVLSYFHIFLYKATAKNKIYHIMSFLCALMPACSLLAWVVFPIAYRNGHVLAEGEDTVKFLYIFSSSYDPLWVSAVAVILIAISITLIVKKRIFHNFLEVRKEIRSKAEIL